MPAISLVFLTAQFLISAVVYYLAEKYDSRSPLLSGILVFVLGFALVFVLDTVIGLFAVQVLIILIYVLRLRAIRESPVSA
jgi:cytochrome c biogenesis protein CcdA